MTVVREGSNFDPERRVMLKSIALASGTLLTDQAISPPALAEGVSGEAEWHESRRRIRVVARI